jgi:hypothetical protein
MSTTIYNMLNNIPMKATFHHEDGVLAHEQNVDGFVEDASLIITLCHADCRVYVEGWTTGQVGSAIRP